MRMGWARENLDLLHLHLWDTDYILYLSSLIWISKKVSLLFVYASQDMEAT